MIRLLVDAARDVSARLASRRFALVLVLVLALPAVFALVFTAATASALDGQARIPVAVVNLDEGIDGARGSTVNSGAELVDDLMDSSELAWDAVDEDTALAGLSDGTYALVLEIPADYSEKVASVDGSDPARAQIQIISSGSENVLATRAGSAALKQVQSRLRADLGEQYMLRVLNNVNGQASTLSLSADGAVMLDSAYDALEQGTVAIAEGLEQTASGTDALAEGVDAIASGVTAAGAGASTVADAMDSTAEQYEALVSAAQGVSSGLTSLHQGLSALVTQASGSLDAASASLGDLVQLQTVLSQQVPGLSAAATDMSDAAPGLSDSATAVRDGIDGARSGVETVAGQADALSEAAVGSDGTGGLVGDARKIDDIAGEWLDRERIIELAEALEAEEPDESQRELIAQFETDASTYAEVSSQLDEDATALAEQAEQTSASAASAAEGLDDAYSAAESFDTSAAAFLSSAERASTAAGLISASCDESSDSVMTAMRAVIAAKMMLVDDEGALAPGAGFASISTLVDQLASDGLVGRGVAVLATGTAATPQVLTGFSSAVEQLGQGNLALGSALGQVGTGISSLGGGLSALAGVQTQLSSGVGQLREGQQTINETLSVAGDELGELASSRDERAEVAASPVTLTTTTLDRVEGSAASVAPIAFGIVLWAGALAASYVLPLADRRAVLAGRALPSVLAGFALTVAFCLVQAAVAGALLTVFGGASPVHAAGFAALLALASLAFAAVAQALRLTCGRFAGAVSLSLLFVQLLCAGAILPAFFTGGIFSALGRVLPVPALIEGLRGAMAGSLANFGGACFVLALWLAVGLVTSLLGTARLRFVRPERAFA
ncbi:YhgE/Pip family protein [uncultured Enorma sp.]|uniref:YhgE/Pip family protein n=1 Tax=uncultured Enorma sp. TaxID=1714346 RepID=UPI0026239A6B|nr:YhgE/Pip family protein [uncultured Enorma sp.]